ncbi:peptide ABC transporter, permease protein (plasmid) [Rhizobium freirei PRF 81]|uniref:Peptide ABC transporter, permease protein n=1 Tax=Rhizobium freirei PRF 81 TaxID=363754 RepID=N6USV5_9HYPH|nr:ABC transporter permease [Rhizobium freirei]ENN83881.1 peptide ABC transporter, permease protein [Rhizobium freirei PRF 81]
MRNTGFHLSLACFGLLVLAALFAPWLAPYAANDPVHMPYAMPGEGGLLGADSLGRDMLSRILYGLRYTIGIALLVSVLAATTGVVLAFISAFRRGWTDLILGRMIDAIMSVPQIIFALVVLAVAGVNLVTLVVTMAVLEATLFYRVIRPVAGDVVAMDYVEVARLRGEGLGWYLFREILPNAAPTLIAEFGIRISYAVLFISGLSFLGVGVQPPAADLGGLVRENALAISVGQLSPLAPAVCIALITLSVNGIVDWFIHKYSVRAELG